MEFNATKTIGFKLNEEEANELTGSLEFLKIDHKNLSAREIILSLAQKAVEGFKELTLVNQEVKSDLTNELKVENQSLTNFNQDLTENNQELDALNKNLNQVKEQLISDNKELKALVEELKSAKPETKVIEKVVPIQLGQYQLLIDLNYFQLALLAKVANHFAVESLFNKQAQLNPAAFVRVEGKPKDRLSQTLVNFFMGVQFNYHRGNTYLPENVLTGDFIRKKGKEYQEQIAD